MRWLIAVCAVAGVGAVLPMTAIAVVAPVLDVPASTQPAAPLGEVVPATDPTTAPAPPPATVIETAPPVVVGGGTGIEVPTAPPAALPVLDGAEEQGVPLVVSVTAVAVAAARDAGAGTAVGLGRWGQVAVGEIVLQDINQRGNRV